MLHPQDMRQLLRLKVMEQAVALGMTTQQALALVERFQLAGAIHVQAESMASMLESLMDEAIRNHAMAMVLNEQAKAQPVNAPLVLTAVN